MKTKQFQLDGVVGLLDLLGRKLISGKMRSISGRDALLSSTWLSTLQHWRDQSDKIHICAKEGEMMITICQKDGFTGLRKITTLVIKAMIPISLL